MTDFLQAAPPGATDVLDAHKRNVQLSINCVQIGIIQSFDAPTQTAKIALSLKQIVSIDADGTRKIADYPVLLQCPVITLFGGNSFLSMPIQTGDNCVILFNDRELNNWLYAGNGQVPTTPRLHDLSDGIAIVGIRPLTNSIASYLINGIRLSYNNGSSKIDLKNALIDSIAALFLHHGNMEVTGDHHTHGDGTVDGTLTVGNLVVEGETFGGGGTWVLNANLLQNPGFEIHDGRQISGTFNTVTVVDGIVTGGS